MTTPKLLAYQSDLFAGLAGQAYLQQAYDALEAELNLYLTDESIIKVREAARFGAQAHAEQKRQSGEPYFTHPIAVAHILASHRFELPVLIAGLLHDVLEDTEVTMGEMAAAFGAEVTALVDGVSKLKRIGDQAPQEVAAESFKKMFIAMADDFRVVIIKLADRLHNMQTLSALRPDKRRRKAIETLDVYASIAEKLGMFSFRVLLEDLVFSNLYPWRFAVLQKHYRALGDTSHRTMLDQVSEALLPELQKIGVKARIRWRRRHLWGVYLRMKRKESFAAACRTIPLRIITDSEDDCYRVLGRLHALYRPIANKFEDYIAAPKSNGYRSLHTSVLSADKDVLNVQIRTTAMHQLAENGILAMLYHHERQRREELDPHSIGAQKYLRDWLSRLKEVETITHNPLEFYNAIKKELTSGGIHVYTPKGQVIDLPKNSTPIDYAYAIHTKIGHHCREARVNGVNYPLFKALETGQTVEIIVDKDSFPHAVWLEFVQTAKARAGINHYLRHLAKQEAAQLAKRLLEIACNRLGGELASVDARRWQAYLSEQGISEEQLWQQIAQNTRQPMLVAQALLSKEQVRLQGDSVLQVVSVMDAGIEFAPCCLPIPQDAVYGLLEDGVAIRLHRRECAFLEADKHHLWIKAGWDLAYRGRFETMIDVRIEDKLGMAAAVTTAISRENGNLTDLQVLLVAESQEVRVMRCRLGVFDRQHLAAILRALRRVSGVVSVNRLQPL